MEFTLNKKTKKERREELNKIINSLDNKLENIEQMEKKNYRLLIIHSLILIKLKNSTIVFPTLVQVKYKKR